MKVCRLIVYCNKSYFNSCSCFLVLICLESCVLAITIFLHSISHWSILAYLVSRNLFDLLIMINLTLVVTLALEVAYLRIKLKEDIVPLEMLCFRDREWTAVPFHYPADEEVITWFLLEHVWVLHYHSFSLLWLILLIDNVVLLLLLPCSLVASEKCLSPIC